jgi:hypothetical protein
MHHAVWSDGVAREVAAWSGAVLVLVLALVSGLVLVLVLVLVSGVVLCSRLLLVSGLVSGVVSLIVLYFVRLRRWSRATA